MKRWWPWLVITLLLAALASSFTLEKSVRDQGYSREAVFNPWLAAGRVLERQGLRVRFAPSYSSLPAHAAVIMLATPLEMLDKKEQQELSAWVKQGGHLVSELQETGITDDDSSELPLLKQLDVRLRDHEQSWKTGKTIQNTTLSDATISREGNIKARFDHHYYLEAGKVAPVWTVSDSSGVHIMRFAVGQGHITLLSDALWVENRYLKTGDHGALFWRVINAEKNAEVWLIHGKDRPSLLALAWEAATPLLCAVALFVLVWLWQASRRFGPLVSVLPESRRKLSEHLEASGRYLFCHQGLPTLFGASRERLLSQVQHHYPQWRRLPAEGLAQHLGERAGIESAAIARVLSAPAPDNLLQFAADIRLINRLRKAL